MSARRIVVVFVLLMAGAVSLAAQGGGAQTADAGWFLVSLLLGPIATVLIVVFDPAAGERP